jgi:hypothetical protein
MNNIADLDTFETTLLMLMCAGETTKILDHQTHKSNKAAGMSCQITDQGNLLHFPSMQPSSCFCTEFDTVNTMADRLYTEDPNMLLRRPQDTIGKKAEIAIMNGNKIQWNGLFRINKLPKQIVCIGKPHTIYAKHYRDYSLSGSTAYQKRLVIFDKNGKELYAMIKRQPITDTSVGVVIASVIEDATRANTVLAELAITGGTAIKFPVPLNSYKELFIIRDGPLTPKNKKKAIIHWVTEHLRHTCKGKTVAVKEHTRGIQEFDIEDFHIKLTPMPMFNKQ